jgi:hypothetical protein
MNIEQQRTRAAVIALHNGHTLGPWREVPAIAARLSVAGPTYTATCNHCGAEAHAHWRMLYYGVTGIHTCAEMRGLLGAPSTQQVA